MERFSLRLKAESVGSADLQVVAELPAHDPLVGVASGEEVGSVGCGGVERARVFYGSIAAGLPFAVLRADHIVETSGLCAEVARIACHSPGAGLAWLTAVVDIVDGSDERQARPVGEPHAEHAPHIARRCASAGLQIEYIAFGVFFLEPDVHHILLVVFELTVCQSACLAIFVVDGDVFHGICSEVVEHKCVVALEEVLAVEHEALHVFAVDIDLSAVAYLHSGQLLHECVEHRSVSQTECVGVIHQCVAFMVKLDFRCGDSHFVEFAASGFVERHVGQLAFVLASADMLYHQRHLLGFIFRV